ncbi:MAG: hypothetical protein HY246_19605 [Proteobacteria bacterium]|nr:hypothetical protein [Pseudomonadota bacterium]
MHVPNSYEIHRQTRSLRSVEMARLASLGCRRVAGALRRAFLRLRTNFRAALPTANRARR